MTSRKPVARLGKVVEKPALVGEKTGLAICFWGSSKLALGNLQVDLMVPTGAKLILA